MIREGLPNNVLFESNHKAAAGLGGGGSGELPCKGPKAAQSFPGLRDMERMEQSGLESKQLRRRLEGHPRQALWEGAGVPQPGLGLRRIPPTVGAGGGEQQ